MADPTRQLAEDFCTESAHPPRALQEWVPSKDKHKPADHGPLQGVARLVLAIETEIIPRLVLARKEEAGEPHGIAIAPAPTTRLQVEQLLAHILDEDAEAAASYVADQIAAGSTVEAVYLHMLAPAARRLGEMWADDLIDFTQVTIGVGRLQLLLRRFNPEFMAELDEIQTGRRILLVPAPDEQHSFGLVMVGEFFRRAGWDVWCDPTQSNHDVLAMVSHQSFSVAGFSLSSPERVDGLTSHIRAVRRASLNKSIGILVGGNAFADNHDLVGLIGADAMALDGKQAVDRAEEMLGLLRIQC